LHTGGGAADRSDRMALYGRFIGDWTMDGIVYLADGATPLGPENVAPPADRIRAPGRIFRKAGLTATDKIRRE
jgi:hypothetical protein